MTAPTVLPFGVKEPGRPPVIRRVLGVDFGLAADHTALAFCEWEAALTPHYHLRGLKRWPLKVAPRDVIADLVALCRKPELEGVTLVCDSTGIGAPLVYGLRDALVDADVRGGLVAVTITGGGEVSPPAVTGETGKWRCAKKVLVSTMLRVLSERRLHMAAGLELGDVLLRELLNYKVKVTDSGNESFESWREKDHDDLCFAAMLAVWAGESMPVLRPPSRHVLPERFVNWV